jgi:hypothetical protein
VGRLYVAYPFLGAMQEPDSRDKRGGTYSHVFFVSISLSVVLESPVAFQTSAIRHQPFVYDQQRELAGQHLCVPSDETKKTKIT